MGVVMVAWKLTDKQWDALDQMRFSTRDAKVFRNATIIFVLRGWLGLERDAAALRFDAALRRFQNAHHAQA